MSISYKRLTDPLAKKLDAYFGFEDSFVEIIPGNILLPSQYEDIGQSILDAPVRQNDIWLLSYPRTGSTWTQEMVWLIGNDFNWEAAKNSVQHKRAPLLELSAVLVNHYDSVMRKYGNSVNVVNSLPSPRYIKSHLPFELLPRQLETVNPKMIYVVRDPKDVCISYYHYCQLVHDMNSSFEEFCDLFLHDKAPFGSFWNHYLTFWRKRRELNIMFIRYEEMQQDLKGMIQRTAKFLEKPITDSQIDQLAEHLSFQNMKSNPAVNLKPFIDIKNGKDFYEKTGKSFIRKGIVGDWKNCMTPEMVKRFDQWREENLRGTGLAFE